MDGLYFDAVEIVTKEEQEEVLPFADDVQFQFVDTTLDFIDVSEKDGNRVYQTDQMEEFLEHRGELNDIPLAEQTIPYIIILQDGKVTHITEELKYTI